MGISIDAIKAASNKAGNSKITIKANVVTLTKDIYDKNTGESSAVTLTESVESLEKRKASLESSAAKDLEAAEAIGKILNNIKS